MNTIQTSIRLALCVGACATLGGCLSSTPEWDQHFGESVTQIKTMQMLNPMASANDDPVAGIDGSAAIAAQTNYVKSFTAPTPPANVFTIGVGTGSSN
ncbi:hypothetical protein [Paraburkholderia gardini]|uniref:hypothetical protein n=1 Tax=Paraburkholderia gardini TaxID=2823469 RepID=UPI001D757627|nr:hypothetical protein [Paraburkholderia gardini]CAG4909240.1 hypothetical protein R69919_03672 [Paraburkholderia gardini]